MAGLWVTSQQACLYVWQGELQGRKESAKWNLLFIFEVLDCLRMLNAFGSLVKAAGLNRRAEDYITESD